MISMRYAQNLSAGHGLTWNPGEPPVAGYTNLLWTLWMALLHFIPVPDSKTSLLVMASGVPILLRHAWCCGRIASCLRPQARWIFQATTVFCAAFYPLAYWTLRGMEVGLLALLIGQGVWYVVQLEDGNEKDRRRIVTRLALCLALGVLTRDDFAVPALVLIAGAVAVVPTRRVGLFLGLTGAMAMTLASLFAFRIAYSGDWLPNTYYLKISGIPASVRVARGISALWTTTLFSLGPAALLIAWHAFSFTDRRRKAEWMLFALVMAQVAYGVYVGGDAWEWMEYANRYLSVAAAPFAVLSVVALSDLSTRYQISLPDARLHSGVDWKVWRPDLGGVVLAFLMWRLIQYADAGPRRIDALTSVGLVRHAWPTYAIWILIGCMLSARALHGQAPRWSVLAWRGALLTALAVAVNARAWSDWGEYNAAQWKDEMGWTRYGVTLGQATPEAARIAVSSAGAITYFSRRRTVDLLGKNDSAIARMNPARTDFPPGHMKWNYAYSIGFLRPELIAETFGAAPADYANFSLWGYVEIWPGLAYARADVAGVDREAIRRVLLETR